MQPYGLSLMYGCIWNIEPPEDKVLSYKANWKEYLSIMDENCIPRMLCLYKPEGWSQCGMASKMLV